MYAMPELFLYHIFNFFVLENEFEHRVNAEAVAVVVVVNDDSANPNV